MILMITGRFLDLNVERQTSVQPRATINLLQTAVTEGPFLMTDSSDNKLKLMIDRTKFDSSDLKECCDSVQYDYKFSIGESPEVEDVGEMISYTYRPEFKILTNYEIDAEYKGEREIDTESFCYTGFGLNSKSAASVPVNICDGDLNKCNQGVAVLETTNSPLSELSYWITQACKADFDLNKSIPLDPNDYFVGNDVQIKNGNLVCLKGVCKKFECDIKFDGAAPISSVRSVIGNKDELLDQVFPRPLTDPEKCHYVKVVRDGGDVFILEGKEDVEDFGLPSDPEMPQDGDAWTESTVSYYFTYSESHEATNEIDDFPAEIAGDVGKSYVILKQKNEVINSRVADVFLALDVTKLPDVDCGGTCIDMKARALNKINFKSVVFSDEDYTGDLTWRLHDTDGNCIENLGSLDVEAVGERGIESADWESYGIKLLEGDEMLKTYNHCGGAAGDFNWKITRMEWKVCAVSGGCGGVSRIIDLPDLFDSPPMALLIDNLYFGRYESG